MLICYYLVLLLVIFERDVEAEMVVWRVFRAWRRGGGWELVGGNDGG